MEDSRSIRTRLEQIRRMPKLISKEERAKYNLDDVSTGSYLMISGKVYRVDAQLRFFVNPKGMWSEFALYCLNDGRHCSLVWREHQSDAELRVLTTDLKHLRVSESDLANFYDSEKGSLVFEDKLFKYSESNKATLVTSNEKGSEDVFYWEFTGVDGGKIRILRWSASDYEVCLFEPIELQAVEVLYK